MSKDTFKMNQPPKPEIFVTEELAHNYNLAKSEYITDCYFYGSSTKIYTFAKIMHEELKYGFMHYHIPKNHHAYFLIQNWRTNTLPLYRRNLAYVADRQEL